jgi:hypothetical protein
MVGILQETTILFFDGLTMITERMLPELLAL